MIKYALQCAACEHDFEAWFASSAGYDEQHRQKHIACPACESVRVSKQIMAPAVSSSKRQANHAKIAAAAKAFASKAREHVANNFDYVGDKFADEARAMHYGDADERPIWGQTTAEESKALKDEGVPAAPLPEPFTPPTPKSDKDIN